MPGTGRVLLVCLRKNTAMAIAENLQRLGLLAVIATSSSQALKMVCDEPCDMIISELQMGDDSGLALLKKMREHFPLTMRVLILNQPMHEIQLESLINESGPHYVFSEGVNGEQVRRMLALEGAVTHQDDKASVDMTLENSKLRALVKRFESENHVLSQELERLRTVDYRKQQEDLHRAHSGERRAARKDDPGMIKVATLMGRAMEELMESDEVVLPVLPEIGLEVQRMVGDENVSFEALAEKVGLEQGMSARILQVANSPMYAGMKRIRNLQQAVGRLGLRETRNILMACLAQNLFSTSSRDLMKINNQLWLHSLCVAYSNENIAQALQLKNSEDYFMMGLLHDIGKLLIIHISELHLRAGKWKTEYLNESIIKGLMDAYHHDFGKKLMQKWEYSDAFKAVVSHHNDDENIQQQPEGVVVTYFSNLIARKLGYSLVPYDVDLLSNKVLAETLNMSAGTQLILEKKLADQVGNIKNSYAVQA